MHWALSLWERGAFRYSVTTMGHRVLLSVLAGLALLVIALSMVWPQGMGRPSPAPFGHPEVEAAR